MIEFRFLTKKMVGEGYHQHPYFYTEKTLQYRLRTSKDSRLVETWGEWVTVPEIPIEEK